MVSNLLLNQIASIGVQATISILSLTGTALVGVAVSYIAKKKDALVAQIGVANYNSDFTIAKSIYFQAEQAFKLIPGAGNLKATMFDNLLLAKVQGLTQDEIEHFREAICGEINTQLKSTNLLAPAYDPTIDKADVKITEPLAALVTDPSVINQTTTNTVVQ